MAAGVDYITMGNHTFKHEDIEEILETTDNIIRPAN
jgi:calcineurin-like phosphoesterase